MSEKKSIQQQQQQQQQQQATRAINIQNRASPLQASSSPPSTHSLPPDFMNYRSRLPGWSEANNNGEPQPELVPESRSVEQRGVYANASTSSSSNRSSPTVVSSNSSHVRISGFTSSGSKTVMSGLPPTSPAPSSALTSGLLNKQSPLFTTANASTTQMQQPSSLSLSLSQSNNNTTTNTVPATATATVATSASQASLSHKDAKKAAKAARKAHAQEKQNALAQGKLPLQTQDSVASTIVVTAATSTPTTTTVAPTTITAAPKIDDSNMTPEQKVKAAQKAERKALFEKQRAEKLAHANNNNNDAGKAHKSNTTPIATPAVKKNVNNSNISHDNDEHSPLIAASTSVGSDSGVNTSNATSDTLMLPKDKSRDSDKNKTRRNSQLGGHAPVMMQYDDPKRVAKHEKKRIVQRTMVQKQVSLFAHLPQYERETSLSLQVGFSQNEIHPAILRLGLRFAEGSIIGSNARCIAMLTAFKQFIAQYTTPQHKVLSRDLDSRLKPLVRFLIDCRPQSISMGNAIRYLKMEIARIPINMPEHQAKALLIQKIEEFIHERIEFADQVIARDGANKIQNQDVILTFSCSTAVEKMLKKAHDQHIAFRVIVVDARPKLEGKTLLSRLVKYGIKCDYILITALSYIIQQVTKVFVGAHSLLANGTVVSRVGTAVVAMMANAYKVPVLVCCETYKFHQRVQLESLSFNELGDPDDLLLRSSSSKNSGLLRDWRDIPGLKLLNLMYDLTPVRYVSLVITEVGLIPPTSVPVILREYHKNKDML